MSLTAIGIGSGDFLDNPLVDFGTSVSLAKATETEDHLGNKTFTYSGTSTITAVFHIRNKTYERTESGERTLAPAYLMSKLSDNVEKNDKIVFGTGTNSQWKVFNINNRVQEGTIFVFSDLYQFE